MVRWKINNKVVLTLLDSGQCVAETEIGTQKGFLSHGVFHPLFIILHDGEKFKERLTTGVNKQITYKMEFTDTFRWGWVATRRNILGYEYPYEIWEMRYKGRIWHVSPEEKKAWLITMPGRSVEGYKNLPDLNEEEIISRTNWSTIIKYNGDAHKE